MNKLKRRNTFKEVLVNCDNQVIVRQLLTDFIPDSVKQQIVDDFNHYIDKCNEAAELLSQSETK